MNSPYRIMKKILTTAVAAMLLLLSAAGAQAQEKRMHFGVKAGANFSTLNYNDYKSNLGYQAGIALQFDFLRRTSSQTTPLLLLDDIFDKLDSRRVEHIVDLVSGGSFGQIFITDTNRDHLDEILSHSGKDYRMFNVEKGEFAEI